MNIKNHLNFGGINSIADMPAAVAHNSVNIEDDYTFNGGSTNPAFGFGIAVQNKLSNVSVNNNTLTGQYSLANSTNSVSLVYCNLIANGGASVACNMASKSKYGYEFSDFCLGTTWKGNYMCDNWAGLALTNGGIIGPQGTAGGNACGNIWNTTCTQWGIGISPWQTFADNSDASLSPLFCWGAASTTNPFYPSFNWFSGSPAVPYSTSSINTPSPPISNMGGDCWQFDPFANTYPLWRGTNTTGLNDLNAKNEIKELTVLPNPTNGKIFIIKTNELDILKIKLFDLSGKMLEFAGKDTGLQFEMDLTGLCEGVYLLEINLNNQNSYHKKIIKTN
jgi:hypothetical protein